MWLVATILDKVSIFPHGPLYGDSCSSRLDHHHLLCSPCPLGTIFLLLRNPSAQSSSSKQGEH